MDLKLKRSLDYWLGRPLLACLNALAAVLGAILHRNHKIEPVQTALFVKFQGLGSLVIAKPALAAFRRNYPNAHCVFWGTATLGPLARQMPEFDEILLLDDLGAHRVTDWVEDTVTSIITHRCNNKKATIATSNLEYKDRQFGTPTEQAIYSKYSLAERIGIRAYSRLFEMCKVIEMPHVGDYRQRNQP